MKKIASLLGLSSIILTGCSATSVIPEAQKVRIVNKEPTNCQFLGEVVGSQGNWITGDYTSNENLMVGARNDLRNEAYKLGANIVHVANLNNSSAWGSLGTTNTTIIGNAYKCN